jgi:hypothetical protein
MAVLPKNESREELRRRLIEEAEERLRGRQLPPMEEVLDEIDRCRESLPKDLKLPDSTALLRESRGYLDDLPSGEVKASTLDEYVAPSWDRAGDRRNPEATTDPSELRRQLIEEAEDYRRRYPVPPLEEVVDEIVRQCSYRPADFGAPDCTTLIREDRER